MPFAIEGRFFSSSKMPFVIEGRFFPRQNRPFAIEGRFLGHVFLPYGNLHVNLLLKGVFFLVKIGRFD